MRSQLNYAIDSKFRKEDQMDCPWYLGLDATEECIKTCTITAENRDVSICPESDRDDFDIT